MAGGFSATYPINFMGMQGMGSDPYGIFGGNGLYRTLMEWDMI